MSQKHGVRRFVTRSLTLLGVIGALALTGFWLGTTFYDSGVPPRAVDNPNSLAMIAARSLVYGSAWAAVVTIVPTRSNPCAWRRRPPLLNHLSCRVFLLILLYEIVYVQIDLSSVVGGQ